MGAAGDAGGGRGPVGGGRMGVREFSVLSDQFCWELKLLERLLWERSKVFSLLVASNLSFFGEKKTTAQKKLAQFGGSDGKASAYNSGDLGLIPGSGRSPGEGMATHSSTLAWRIPWTEEPGGLLSMGSQRVGHD